MLWVEKYRPKKFEDVVGLPQEIPTSLSNMPHFLFLGKAGTGKTTTARIIIKELQAESLLLNASDERGIDTIRDKVKNFAMTKSSNGNFKIVFLDESDALTSDAQNSLRNLMESYHNNCRFILTGNYENKIIDALKSRCTAFKFDSDVRHITAYLKNISAQEGLSITEELLSVIVERNHRDIRKCVNQLQRLGELNRPVTLNDLNKESELPATIHAILRASDFIKARQTLLDANVEYAHFLKEYHTFINTEALVNKKMSGSQYAMIINYLADAISKVDRVIDPEVIVENFMLKTIGVLK